MSEPAIVVENLSKKYKIGLRARANRTFREAVTDAIKAPFRRLRALREKSNGEDTIWALKDVSFAVQPGEVVGIIGRNGAGKSTLLKILSRITEPTIGRALIRGRVRSLLEVGTGFHPELTGRENIYLNGAILGMKKTEIDSKFDEIIAFAEVEKFLDTPVKRYSSGMYVRLAFAVAAHLEPEILIVDEVLAVGDASFQKKCLGKMGETARGGRTVIFVSHNMPSIQQMCSRAILLNEGKIVAADSTDRVVAAYLAGAATTASAADLSLLPPARRRGTGVAQFVRIELFGADGRMAQEIRFGEPLVVRLHIWAKKAIDRVVFGFSFVAANGTEVMGTTAHDGGMPNSLEAGMQIFTCEVRPMILCPGHYYIRAAIFRQGEMFDYIDEMIGFDVLNAAFDLASAPANHLVGHIYIPFRWQHEQASQRAR